MRLLDGDDVDALADGPLGLTAARDTAMLVSSGELDTGRVQIGDRQAWMRILAGVLPSLDLLGYKEFHRVGKDVRYHISLFRHSTGEAIGIVDGRRITSLRTSSTAALAFRELFAAGGSPASAEVPLALGVIGSGEEAREGLRAVAGAVRLSGARVYSPTQGNRAAFAESMSSELGISVEAADSVAEALRGVGAAYVATAATTPVVRYADVAHLPLVAAVGATRPDHHELAGEVVTRAATVVVDCEDALHEPGDMRDARRVGWDESNAIVLGRWLEQRATAGRQQAGAESDEGWNDPGMTLFKSIGSVEQDLVLAHRLLLAGEERGLGRVVDPIGSLRVMR